MNRNHSLLHIVGKWKASKVQFTFFFFYPFYFLRERERIRCTADGYIHLWTLRIFILHHTSQGFPSTELCKISYTSRGIMPFTELNPWEKSVFFFFTLPSCSKPCRQLKAAMTHSLFDVYLLFSAMALLAGYTEEHFCVHVWQLCN